MNVESVGGVSGLKYCSYYAMGHFSSMVKYVAGILISKNICY